MMNFRTIGLKAFMLTALAPVLTSVAMAQTCTPASKGGHANMAGLYTLSGVREVGSQIRLQANGQFQYMLAYGAVDELAEGCWQRINDVVFLDATRMQVSRGGNKFSRLRLVVDPQGGLVRQFSPQHMGTYRRSR